MSRPGPKPLPNNVHALRGNPSKKPLAALKNGARVPVEIPKAPPGLTAGAKKVWARVSPKLQRLGVIADVDESALVRYCIAYSRYLEVEKEIERLNKKESFSGLTTRTPSGYEQQSVLFQIRSKCHEELKGLEQVFGMTPSARTSVDVNPQSDLFGDHGESGEEKDPAAKYF